jgi:outer membrane protein OmpA-like peptidoglycan-associated protein
MSDTPSTPQPVTATATAFTHGRLLVLTTLAVAVIGALAGCASPPAANPALDQARSSFEAARARPDVGLLAAAELTRAGATLDRAERARVDGETLATVDHLAYLARQQVVIAEQTADSRSAQSVTAGAAAERDRMRLALRNAELATAERRLGSAERQVNRQGEELASAVQANDRQSAALALAAQANDRQSAALALSAQANDRKSAELAQADATAQAERTRLALRDARVADLETQLRELNARKSERGIVVTLGDLLFATGQATLQPEGLRSVARLADFLKRNPERLAAIEGYTDDVGSESSNLSLSDRRARAVMEALQQMGVSATRLSTQGLGEGRPVADNATAGGRQMNRRVEVVFAAQAGDVLLK